MQILSAFFPGPQASRLQLTGAPDTRPCRRDACGPRKERAQVRNYQFRKAHIMNTQFSRALASLMIVLFSLSPVWATCGGGGGGGTGGVGGGGRNTGPAPTVYNVPWNMWEARKAPQQGLVLYWFPANNAEVDKSTLRKSRILTLYAAQCITMTVADAKTPELPW